MSNLLSDRIAALESRISEDLQVKQKKASTMVTVYIGVIVLLTLYLHVFLLPTWKAKLEPEEIAGVVEELLSSKVDEGREYIITFLTSDESPKMLVEEVVKYVPEAENRIMITIDDLTDTVVARIEGGFVDSFSDFIKGDSQELKDFHEQIKDQDVAEGLASLFIDMIDEELGKYVNDHFVKNVDDMNENLARLANPTAKLTKREDATRQVIMYWGYLADQMDYGDEVISALIDNVYSGITKRWALVTRDTEIEIQGVNLANPTPKPEPELEE